MCEINPLSNNEYIKEEAELFFRNAATIIKLENSYIDYIMIEKLFSLAVKMRNAERFVEKFIQILYEADINNERIAEFLQSISMNAAVLGVIAEENENKEKFQEVYDIIYTEAEKMI